MKKHISLFLIATMLLTALLSFGSVALAASVTFNISADSKELASGDTVTFTFDVTSDTSFSDCNIYYNNSALVPNGLGNLVPNQTVPGSFKMNITNEMLDKALNFEVRDVNGQVLATKSVTIAKKAQNVKVAATVKPSRTLAGQGNVVEIAVTVENQGDVDATGITIRASGISSNPLSGAFDLRPGRSHTIKYNYTMGSKDVTFSTTIDFNAAGTAQKLTLDPITITLESRSVDVTAAASNNNPQPGEEVTFTLNITNNGNVPYTDLTVLLNGESVKAPSSRLNAGDSLTGTYTRTFQTSTEVTFTITLKDHTGAVRTVDSNKVDIRLPVDQGAFDQMQFTMAVDRPQMTSAGVVNFTGSVINTTTYTLTDINVSEAAFGSIYNQTSLSPSGRANIEWSADINETTEYIFSLTFTDADGNTHTVMADPITVTVQSVEETPDLDDAVVLEPDNSGGLGTTGVLLIIAGVLVLLIIGVGVALLILWKKGKTPGGKKTPPGGRNTPPGGRNTPTGRKRPATPARGSAPRNGSTPRGGSKKPVSKSYRDRNNF